MNEQNTWMDWFKKWYLILLLIAAFVVSIFLSMDFAENETRLVLWEIGAGDNQWGHGWTKINQLFEERHPGVKIVTPPGVGTSWSQKLMSAIVGDAAPDLVGGFGVESYTSEWAARGAILPLNDFIEKDRGTPGSINPDDWVHGARETMEYEGKFYGIPVTTVSAALFYNRDAFISAGIVDEQGNPKLPGTTEGYLKFCKQYSIRDEKGKIKRIGSLMGYHHMMRLYRMGVLFGGRFFSENGRRATFTDPQIVKALEYMTEHSDYLGGPGNFKIFGSGDWKEGTGGGDKAIFSGQLATLMHGQFYLTNIVYNAPDLNFGITDLPQPADVPKTNLVISYGASIPKGAKYPELAWEYIKLVVSPEGQKLMAETNLRFTKSRGIPFTPFTTGIRPVDKMLWEEIVKDNPDFKPETRQIYKQFLDKLENSKNCDPVTSPIGAKVMRVLDRAHDLAVFHEKSPHDALKEAEEIIQRDLDDFFADSALTPVNWGLIWQIISLISLLAIGLLFWGVRKLRLSQTRRRDLAGGLISITPWLVGFIIFLVGPIIFSVILSFTKYSGLGEAQWIGLQNYSDLLKNDSLFWKSLVNTGFMLIGVPLNMAVGLGIALLLNMRVKGVNLYRTIYYLPSIIPFVATSILWIWILDPTNGILNILLAKIGIEGPAWLGDANWTKPSLLIMGIWTAGSGMVIWLAGLKGIPVQLYESAWVDGAGWWKQFKHITLPMLTPYIFFNLIMGIIGTLQIFAQAVIMGSSGTQKAGPLDSLLFYVYYLFNNAFVDFKMGYASAMAWILFFLILILTLVQLKLAPKWVHYEESK